MALTSPSTATSTTTSASPRISVGFTTQGGVSIHNYTYTFGPQLSLRANKAYTPFVHVLIGGDHASASFGWCQRNRQRLCA